jgi:hypothetical protein
MTMHDDQSKEFLDSLPELKAGESFRFACHPGVPCFNACCGDLNLMLTPYDVLRLRRSLKESSREFISGRAELHRAPDTGLPALKLRMDEARAKACPFVTEGGCSVYPDRPAACRTYPLGRATRLDENGELFERYFVVREAHCRGFEEGRDFTAPQWLADQGLEPYNHSNDKLMRLMAMQRETGRPVTADQANMALLALYQLDSFGDFIRDMKVLDRLELSLERRRAVLEDEEARLDFALDWLKLVLFRKCEALGVAG